MRKPPYLAHTHRAHVHRALIHTGFAFLAADLIGLAIGVPELFHWHEAVYRVAGVLTVAASYVE